MANLLWILQSKTAESSLLTTNPRLVKRKMIYEWEFKDRPSKNEIKTIIIYAVHIYYKNSIIINLEEEMRFS